MLESPHIGSILMCFALKIYLLLFASNYHTMNTLIQRIWWLPKYWHCRKGIFSMGRGVQYQAKDNCANYWLKWLLLFANNHYKYREDNDKLIIFFPFFNIFLHLKFARYQISDYLKDMKIKQCKPTVFVGPTRLRIICAHIDLGVDLVFYQFVPNHTGWSTHNKIYDFKNKLASLEATLVRNYDLITRWRGWSVELLA